MEALKKSLGFSSFHEEPKVVKATKAGPVDPRFISCLEQIERGSPPADCIDFCRSISLHRGHGELQGRGMRSLSVHGPHILNPQHMSGELAVELAQAIIGALVSHKPQVAVVEQCLFSICIFSQHGEVRLQIWKHKGVKRIISAMERYPAQRNVQEYGCWGLASLAATCDASLEIQRRGGLTILLSAMDRYKDVPAIQLAVCKAVRNLAVLSENRHQMSSSVWIFKRILDAMARSDRPELLEQAMIALANLTANNGATCVEIANAGGVDRILHAMERNIECPDMQKAGCSFLRNIAAVESVQLMIVQKGGIQRIKQAIEAHMSVGMIVSEAFQSLANLSRSAQNHEMDGPADFELIHKCLDLHEDDYYVQEQGVHLMLCLGSENNQVHKTIVEMGGVERLRRAMHKNNATKSTLSWAQTLLNGIEKPGPGMCATRKQPQIIASVGSEAELTRNDRFLI